MWVVRGTLAIAVVLTLAAPAHAAATTVSQRDGAESKLVRRINHVRENHGLPRLTVASRLERAATRHSNSMGKHGYFRHELRYKGGWKSFGAWIRWFWPGPGYSSWSAGENLAWGAPDLAVRKTVSLWMHSAGHRANLLSTRWKRIGISVVHVKNPRGAFGGFHAATIVTADFGSRSN